MSCNNFIDPSQIATAICENDNKTLRDLFKGKINGSFLPKSKPKSLSDLASLSLLITPCSLITPGLLRAPMKRLNMISVE